MDHLSNNAADLQPLFDGVPVIVRLVSADDIICVLYHRGTEDDPRIYMERPLRVIMDELATEPLNDRPRSTSVLYSRVRSRFERWMPFTTATIFPIYNDHVLSIAPMADQYIQGYVEWANQLYATDTELPANSLMEKAEPTREDVQKSYFDFILHNYTPKGKPN